MKIDQRKRLEKEPFAYRRAKDKVFLLYEGKQVKILKGKAAQKFLDQIEDKDSLSQQLVMAKLTGNFKRGTEP